MRSRPRPHTTPAGMSYSAWIAQTARKEFTIRAGQPVQPPQLRECLDAYGQEPFGRTEEARLDAAGHYR